MVASTIGVWPTISRITLSAAAFTVFSGSRTLKQELGGVADPPQHDEVDVDDVLVAGEHQRLVAARRARPMRAAAVGWPAERKPTSTRLTRVTGGFIDRLDRRRQVVVAGPGR